MMALDTRRQETESIPLELTVWIGPGKHGKTSAQPSSLRLRLKYIWLRTQVHLSQDTKGGNFGDEPEENEDELSDRDIEENDE